MKEDFPRQPLGAATGTAPGGPRGATAGATARRIMAGAAVVVAAQVLGLFTVSSDTSVQLHAMMCPLSAASTTTSAGAPQPVPRICPPRYL